MSEFDGDGEGGVHFEIHVPPDLERGVYANFLSVWHTAHEFTFDFAVTLPAHPAELPGGGAGTVVPAQVVARVKVPPTLVFNVLQAINENMTMYEGAFGSIRRPGEEPPPPAGSAG